MRPRNIGNNKLRAAVSARLNKPADEITAADVDNLIAALGEQHHRNRPEVDPLDQLDLEPLLEAVISTDAAIADSELQRGRALALLHEKWGMSWAHIAATLGRPLWQVQRWAEPHRNGKQHTTNGGEHRG